MNELSSSTSPYASTRGSSLRVCEPSKSRVSPRSPIRVEIFIFLRAPSNDAIPQGESAWSNPACDRDRHDPSDDRIRAESLVRKILLRRDSGAFPFGRASRLSACDDVERARENWGYSGNLPNPPRNCLQRRPEMKP